MVTANRILAYRSHPYAIPALLTITFLSLLFLFIPHTPSTPSPPAPIRPGTPGAPKITHIVLFSFVPGLAWSVQQSISTSMLNLASTCLHPKTGKPYIRSGIGGTDNSPEQKQAGFTHVFVVEFESEEDRDYYVKEDPVHKAFKAGLEGKIKEALVVDFERGIFLQPKTPSEVGKGGVAKPGAGDDD